MSTEAAPNAPDLAARGDRAHQRRGFHDRRMTVYARFLAGLHIAGGTFYLVAPTFFFDCLNFAARFVGMHEVPQRSEDFWRALAVSMMYMVAACCAMAASEMRRWYPVLLIVVLSKATSTLQFGVYLTRTGVFAHLVGVVVDGSLFGTVLYGYLMVKREAERG
jgi:hypothetical protein